MNPADAPTSTEPHGRDARLALPSWRADGRDAARVVGEIDSWTTSAALRSIVEAHGERMPDAAEPGRLLDQLTAFSDRWDARAGRERDRADPRSWPAPVERAMTRAAVPLGLADREAPPADSYDAIVMTGGMVRAEVVKPRFARKLIDGGVPAGRIVFLGAFRAFSDGETRLAEALGISARDEYDAMVEGLRRVFPGSMSDVAGDGDAGPAAWRETGWPSGASRVAVVAAPSSDPARGRADTADTFRFWAGRVGASVRSVLVVTTPVYVPYQSAVAVDVLGREYGMRVDTVGTSAAASDLGPLTQPFLTQHHLQELRSALRAMRALRAALTGADG